MILQKKKKKKNFRILNGMARDYFQRENFLKKLKNEFK